MPQSPWTPLVQIAIAFSALCVAASAVTYSISAWHEDKNARLVEIGVSILRADPNKEPSAASSRLWALDLIDANAGGVKFSTEARAELMKQALSAKTGSLWNGDTVTYSDYAPGYHNDYSKEKGRP